MLENSERSVRGVRMGKSGPLERAELANQIQGFRIPDRWDASEKIKNSYKTGKGIKLKLLYIELTISFLNFEMLVNIRNQRLCKIT